MDKPSTSASAAAAAPAGVPPVDAALEEARDRLRAPWAASVAGILFAVFFSLALLAMRSSPLATADDASIARLFAEGADQGLLVGGLYLAPFAGIMFLWFVAVIRDQVGEREDKFFATVFFGSGLLFVALLFASAAAAAAVAAGVRYLGLEPPTAAEIGLLRTLSYTLLFGFATRAAAVCLFSIATLGLRSVTFPRWFAWTGYIIGLAMLLIVTFWDWTFLLLPAWVALVSLFILRRERGRTRRRGSAARSVGVAR